MKFLKMHGLGNDYVFLGPEESLRVSDPAALAREISRAHFGVGSDGLVLILPSLCADAKMRIFNKDGSEAEMCGNALRCIGRYLYEAGKLKEPRASVETLDGVKTLRVNLKEGKVRSVTADMGLPAFEPPGAEKPDSVEIELGGRMVRFLRVSMGNPHAVTYDIFPGDAEFAHFGAYVERHALFPNRTNVEFCRVLSREKAQVRVWERGSGATLACGTGASAAFVAGTALGLLDAKAEILLPGGKLLFRYGTTGHVLVTGPAQLSFTGEFPDK